MKHKTHMNYDNTKKMLNTLRNLTESTLEKGTISEQEEKKELKDNVIVVNGVEVRLISSTDEDLDVNEVQKKTIGDVISNFGTQVSDLGDLRPGVTIQSNQVRLDGNYLTLV